MNSIFLKRNSSLRNVKAETARKAAADAETKAAEDVVSKKEALAQWMEDEKERRAADRRKELEEARLNRERMMKEREEEVIHWSRLHMPCVGNHFLFLCRPGKRRNGKQRKRRIAKRGRKERRERRNEPPGCLRCSALFLLLLSLLISLIAYSPGHYMYKDTLTPRCTLLSGSPGFAIYTTRNP